MNVASTPVLEVRGLTKRFGPLLVLEDVNLKVDAGQTICILGPSGSGKSTLLRCINWLETPDSGEIYLRGDRVGFKKSAGSLAIPMSDAELAKLRARTAMVFQHFNLWPHRTV